MNSQLTVYKASAGSGKTFTLAKEYMVLVIQDPSSYRNILAVTFTNKATEEMKNRILSKLYGIANRLDDSRDYLEQIKGVLSQMSEEQIVENAGIALKILSTIIIISASKRLIHSSRVYSVIWHVNLI